MSSDSLFWSMETGRNNSNILEYFLSTPRRFVLEFRRSVFRVAPFAFGSTPDGWYGLSLVRSMLTSLKLFFDSCLVLLSSYYEICFYLSCLPFFGNQNVALLESVCQVLNAYQHMLKKHLQIIHQGRDWQLLHHLIPRRQKYMQTVLEVLKLILSAHF